MDLSESIGFFLGRASRSLKYAFNKMLDVHGFDISSEQWHILMCLWQKDGLSQSEIIERCSKEKTTVTRLINGLEKKNMIVRIKDKSDKRNNLVYLTNYGKESKEKLIPIAEMTVRKAIDGINENQLITLNKLLTQIFNNLNDK